MITQAFNNININKMNRNYASLRMASNPFEQIIESFQQLISPKGDGKSKKDGSIYDEEINEIKAMLVQAAETKKEVYKMFLY
jgi:hypothetical protein